MPNSQHSDNVFRLQTPQEKRKKFSAPRLPRRDNPLLLPGVIIAINVLTWLWMVVHGVNWLAPSTADLEVWGGNIALLTLTDQPWRLFTSMFMHAGLLHLFVNMYFLWQIGPLLVQRKGNTGFFIVYLIGGLLASAVSAWWQTKTMFDAGNIFTGNAAPAVKLIVSVGASGAIMAVAGALTWNLVASHYFSPAGQRHGNSNAWSEKQLMYALLRIVGINIVLGGVISGVDQAAHVGGLLAGILLGSILPSLTRSESARVRWMRYTAATVIGLSVLAGFLRLADPNMLEMVKNHLLSLR